MGNMFQPSKANSVESYLANLAPERREPILFLHDLIQKTVPKLKPYFSYNMLGYGAVKYKNYKKQVIDWPIIGLASQKNYISLYVCAIKDKQYIAEKYKSSLGEKVKVGKSCISFKKIEDINLTVLKIVLKEAEKSPGLIEK